MLRVMQDLNLLAHNAVKFHGAPSLNPNGISAIATNLKEVLDDFFVCVRAYPCRKIICICVRIRRGGYPILNQTPALGRVDHVVCQRQKTLRRTRGVHTFIVGKG